MEFFAPAAWFLIFRTAWFLVYHTHSATDEKQKRSYACHCPFVRSSIANGSLKVDPLWCYCTGGFEKMPFDVIFGKELPVEVLQTVLGGDPRCRFAITLPDEALPIEER